MDTLPSLPSLTPDDHHWRVDWFGDVAYPATVQRYSQPSIRVALSRLLCDPQDLTALVSPSATDHHHQHEAWIPVSALPLVSVGDVWHQGIHVATPPYEEQSFNDIVIRPDTVSFVKAGLALEEHFLLPLEHHPWHRRHTQAYAVAVMLGDSRRLIVPCVELIRFYFGSSGNLLRRLFIGPLTENTLWLNKHVDGESGHLHIALAPGLSGMSAADIGRIALDRHAWYAAAKIYSSCQKASAQRHPIYPFTGFPFEGTTHLAVSGMWLPLGGQQNSTFIVNRLRSCSHRFPFRSLSYEASDKTLRRAPVSGTPNIGNGSKFKSVASKRAPKMADSDAGRTKPQRRIEFNTRVRFPDLDTKAVWREKIENFPSADVFLRHPDGTLEQVAFGEPANASNVQGLDTVAKQAGQRVPPTVSLPGFIMRGIFLILRHLTAQNIHSIKISPVDHGQGRENPVFALPVVVDKDGEISRQVLMTGADGKTRSRRGCFVAVSHSEAPDYFMAIVEAPFQAAPPLILELAHLSIIQILDRLLASQGRLAQ